MDKTTASSSKWKKQYQNESSFFVYHVVRSRLCLLVFVGMGFLAATLQAIPMILWLSSPQGENFPLKPPATNRTESSPIHKIIADTNSNTTTTTSTTTPTTRTEALKASPKSILQNKTNERNERPASPNQTRRVIYSLARGDRSGAAIQDMLMCHAYAYHTNAIYGGACAKNWSMPPFDSNKINIYHLLSSLGLEQELPLACPPTLPVIPQLTGRQHYIHNDTGIFTKDYVDFLQQRVRHNATRQEQSSTSFPLRNIVVHIRRGDISPCRPRTRGYPRYLPNSHYLTLIERYAQVLINEGQLEAEDHQPIKVQTTIYSESESFESFDNFTQRGFNVILDGDIEEVWNGLVTSLPDVIILSRSSFSLVPAILSKAHHIVYTPFWHAPLPHWDIVDDDLMNRTLLDFRRLKATCPPKSETKKKQKQQRRQQLHVK